MKLISIMQYTYSMNNIVLFLACLSLAHAFITSSLRTTRTLPQPQTTVFSNDNPKRMGDILKDHEIHGWQPNADLSVDENFMDLCMIVTRNSKLKQGSMACILANQDTQNKELSSTTDVSDSIISVSNNRPLFSKKDSDIHAEIAALGDACRKGIPTENATAYITMPPCTRCFAALTAAGVKRIVTRYGPPQKLQGAAARNNMDWIAISNHSEMMKRVNTIVNKKGGEKKRKNGDSNDESQKEGMAKKNRTENS